MTSRSTRTPNCAVEAAIAVIGGRWKSLILWNLRDGPLRFSELDNRAEGISKRMLTRQLTELIEDGVVVKTTYDEAVPHTEYELTERGRSLRPILRDLHQWGLDHTPFRKP